MRILLLLIALSLTSANSAAVELFGVPLVTANKASLGLAARAAGASLQDTALPEVFEIFDSAGVLAESQRLYLGFDAQDNSFAFAEYHIQPLSHRRMLKKLTRKYGQPTVVPGKFISDQHYSWNKDGIEISYQRTWGCRCSELRYASAAKLQTIQQQHAQVQRQREDEDLAGQSKNY